jgi:hypothetical protein
VIEATREFLVMSNEKATAKTKPFFEGKGAET